jgi:hypothetical protein
MVVVTDEILFEGVQWGALNCVGGIEFGGVVESLPRPDVPVGKNGKKVTPTQPAWANADCESCAFSGSVGYWPDALIAPHGIGNGAIVEAHSLQEFFGMLAADLLRRPPVNKKAILADGQVVSAILGVAFADSMHRRWLEGKSGADGGDVDRLEVHCSALLVRVYG